MVIVSYSYSLLMLMFFFIHSWCGVMFFPVKCRGMNGKLSMVVFNRCSNMHSQYLATINSVSCSTTCLLLRMSFKTITIYSTSILPIYLRNIFGISPFIERIGGFLGSGHSTTQTSTPLVVSPAGGFLLVKVADAHPDRFFLVTRCC